MLPAPADAVAGTLAVSPTLGTVVPDGSGGTVVAGTARRSWRTWGAAGSVVVVGLMLLVWRLWGDGGGEGVVVPGAPPEFPAMAGGASTRGDPVVVEQVAAASSPGVRSEGSAPEPVRSRPPRSTPPVVDPAVADVDLDPPAAAPENSDREAPYGPWGGSYGGKVARFRFDGTGGEISGTVVVTWQGQSVGTPVTGRYDASVRRMELSDAIDVPDGGTYVLNFSPDLGGFSGSFVRRDGQGRVVLQGWR